MNTIGIDNNLDRPRIKKLLVIGLFASFLTGSRLHADGAKDDPFYEPKSELMKLGLPEHLILWPVLFCPAVGFIAAGIGTLIR